MWKMRHRLFFLVRSKCRNVYTDYCSGSFFNELDLTIRMCNLLLAPALCHICSGDFVSVLFLCYVNNYLLSDVELINDCMMVGVVECMFSQKAHLATKLYCHIFVDKMLKLLCGFYLRQRLLCLSCLFLLVATFQFA